MDKTPIQILQKHIGYYQSFIVKLETKEGIDKNANQEKLDGLIAGCKKKIAEFEIAIKLLTPVTA